MEKCELCGIYIEIGNDPAVVCKYGLVCDVCGDALIHDAVCDEIHASDSEEEWAF